MTVVILILSFLGWEVGLEVKPPERCWRATTFAYKGDRLAGGVAPFLGRRVKPDDMLVAHRSRPLGQMVWVCHGRDDSRCALAVVGDRGPFGRIVRGKWRNAADRLIYAANRERTLVADRTRPGRWAGCLDMTPAVSQVVGSDGADPVMVRTVTGIVIRRAPGPTGDDAGIANHVEITWAALPHIPTEHL